MKNCHKIFEEILLIAFDRMKMAIMAKMAIKFYSAGFLLYSTFIEELAQND